MGSNAKLGLAALSVFLLAHTAGALAQTRSDIGVAAAVNPQAEGTPADGETRTLRVGVNVQSNERIVTAEGGQAQMLFIDESTFTIGPNSDVVLDEFVFDPDTGTGRIALTATKGVFRMVGGKISKRTPVTLKTPTAVIGIRGGIVLVNVAANGSTQAIFLFGDAMTVGTAGGNLSVTRPGFSVTAASASAPPSNPVQATGDQLSASLGTLEGSAPPADEGGGESAGGGQVPTNQNVAASNIGALGSNSAPNALGAAAPPPPPVGGGQTGEQTGQAAGRQAQQNNTLQSSDNLGFSISRNFVGRITHATRLAGSTSSTLTFGLDRPQGSLDKPFQTSSVSGIVRRKDAGARQGAGVFSANLGSSGFFRAPLAAGTKTGISATSQPFGSGTLTGTSVLSSDNQFILYELTDQADNHRVLAFAGIPTTTFPTTGATFFRARDDFILGSRVVGLPAADGGNLAVTSSDTNAAIYWNTSLSTTAQRPFAAILGGVVGTGASQQMAFSLFVGQVKTDTTGTVIEGNFGGFSYLTGDGASPRLFDGRFESACNCDNTIATETEYDFYGTNAAHFIISSGDLPNTSTLSPFERFRGVETVQKYNPAINFNAATDTLTTRSAHLASNTGVTFNRQLTGFVAGVGASIVQSGGAVTPFTFNSRLVDPNGVKIQTDPNTNKITSTFDMVKSNGGSDVLFVTMGDKDTRFGTSPATSGKSAFFDDETFASTVDCDGTTACTGVATFNGGPAQDGIVTMVTTDDIRGLTGTYANCTYCSWGLIRGEIAPSSPLTFERFTGFWTAGAVQDLAQIPATGTATYGGHMVAFVNNNGAQYIEHGNTSVSVNFAGSGTNGTMTVSNFDGGGFTSTFSAVTATSPGHVFTGSMTGTGALSSVTGSMAGSFFTNAAGQAVAGMGGKVFGYGTVGGNAYRFGGIHLETCTTGACQ